MVLNKKHNTLLHSFLVLMVLLLPSSSIYAQQDDQDSYDDEYYDNDYYYNDEYNVEEESFDASPDDNRSEIDRFSKPIDKRSADRKAWEKAREGLSYNGKPPADQYNDSDEEHDKGSGAENEDSNGRGGDGNGNDNYGNSDQREGYSGDARKDHEEKVARSSPMFNIPDYVIKILMYTGIALFVVLLIWLIYNIAKNATGNPDNKAVVYKGSISENLQHIEENLMKSDLEIALERAIAEGDYKTAIRIYYLMIIKELSVKQWIKWKRDKTNGEYQREMKGRSEYIAFHQLTLMFETVWYGDTSIDKDMYDKLSPDFERFVAQIKSNSPA